VKPLFPVVLFFSALTGALAAELQPATLNLGADAPDFRLPATDGRNYTLKDFSTAKVLVVLFTCNHCPTAQYYEARVKEFVSDYQAKGVALVAIMPNDPKSVRLDELGWTDLSDSLEEMKIRAHDRGYNYPYLYDGDTETVSRAYGPVATPHVFVFDAPRKLRYAGAIDDSERVQHVTKHYLRDAVDALLAGKEPAVTRTKIVGCSTKWAGKADSVKTYLEKLAAEGKFPQALGDAVGFKLDCFSEDFRIRPEGDQGAGAFGFADDLEFAGRFAAGKFHLVNLAIARYFNGKPFRDGVHAFGADSVGAAGVGIAALAVFAA